MRETARGSFVAFPMCSGCVAFDWFFRRHNPRTHQGRNFPKDSLFAKLVVKILPTLHAKKIE